MLAVPACTLNEYSVAQVDEASLPVAQVNVVFDGHVHVSIVGHFPVHTCRVLACDPEGDVIITRVMFTSASSECSKYCHCYRGINHLGHDAAWHDPCGTQTTRGVRNTARVVCGSPGRGLPCQLLTWF